MPFLFQLICAQVKVISPSPAASGQCTLVRRGSAHLWSLTFFIFLPTSIGPKVQISIFNDWILWRNMFWRIPSSNVDLVVVFEPESDLRNKWLKHAEEAMVEPMKFGGRSLRRCLLILGIRDTSCRMEIRDLTAC